MNGVLRAQPAKVGEEIRDDLGTDQVLGLKDGSHLKVSLREERPYLMAMGLMGDPTAPVINSGAAITMNS